MGRTGSLILVVVAVAAGVVIGALLLPMVKAGTAGPAKVCVYSNSTAIARSKAGKSVAARLQQLAEQAQASEKNKSQDKNQDKTKDRQTLNARLDHTRATVMGRINSKIVTPLVKKTYQANHCTVLLKADATFWASKSANLTPIITQALDKKVTKVRFDLLPVPDRKSN